MATLTQLGYAVAVERERNFARAAATCFVTQPTLSMQLHKLEEELGVVLFDRSRKPVAPTNEGKALLTQFRAVLREHDRIDDVLRELRGVVGGVYRLGVIPTMAPYVLPRLLPAFRAAYPEVELHIDEVTTEEIVRRLVDETLDGGILATPLGDRRIEEFPICEEDFLVYQSPDVQLPTDAKGRVRLDELPVEKLLVMREGHCLRTQTLDLCSLGEDASQSQGFVMEAGSLVTLCKMVRQGPFFTVIPAMAAADLSQAGDAELVKEIAQRVPYRQISLVVHRAQTRQAVRDALLEVATEQLRAPKSRRRREADPVVPV